MWALFKKYMLSFMKDERESFHSTAFSRYLDTAVRGGLHFLSRIYTAGIKVVDWSYKSGFRRKYRVSVPVISVGNITLGGTGKTPFAIFLADYFLSRGRNPAVLIRGYGKDEDRMIREELPDVSVYAGQDRVRSARRAVKDGKDVIILDDGFQHRRMDRNLNILMLDSVSLFGNGFLFPRGILREPVSSLKRADLFVLTKTDRIDAARRKNIVHKLRRIAPGKSVILARHKPSFLTDVTNAAYPANSLSGKRVFLVCGIVDSDYFAFLVQREGALIVARRDYPDHYSYSQRDVSNIYAECIRKKAENIVVTRKDYIKLKELDISSIEDKLFILNIVIDIIEGREHLIAGLNSVVSCQGA